MKTTPAPPLFPESVVTKAYTHGSLKSLLSETAPLMDKVTCEDADPNGEERLEAYLEASQHESMTCDTIRAPSYSTTDCPTTMRDSGYLGDHPPTFDGCEPFVQTLWGRYLKSGLNQVSVEVTPELNKEFPELSVGAKVLLVKAFDGCVHSQIIRCSRN